MSAATEPDTSSRQVQHLIWAMGEARRRRLERNLEHGGEGIPVAADAVPPSPSAVLGQMDFFTEWQPAGHT